MKDADRFKLRFGTTLFKNSQSIRRINLNDTQFIACPLCESQAVEPKAHGDTDLIAVKCLVCGDFVISPEAMLQLKNDRATAQKITLACRYASALGSSPIEILTTTIGSIASSVPDARDVETKARALLWHVSRKTIPSQELEIVRDFDYPLAYACNSNELEYLCNYLVEKGWVTNLASNYSHGLTLTPAGWEAARGFGNINSNQGFVAMWFDNEVLPVYLDALRPAMNDAGYKVCRVDQEHFNGDVIDWMLAEIRSSRYVVSDVTGNRNGVYFEAGFAMGLGMPVIFTCRKDWIKELHFDINHFNFIPWETADDLRPRLKNRIEATIGRGNYNLAESQ